MKGVVSARKVLLMKERGQEWQRIAGSKGHGERTAVDRFEVL
jgi:hypothetical protein